MSTRFRLLWLCFVAIGVSAPRVFAEPPPAEGPLPTDPALVRGQLENGLTYIVRRHANPPGRAVIWMHMGTGSLNETDRQRGIAHYLEHMAFNGSANFPPGSVVPFFQSLGMTFGRDQNAFTNMEQTTFQLSLPDTKPETLGKGMTFFSDVMYQLLLTPKEIDAERQIIQEERRRGLSGRQRTGDFVMDRIAPGSLYSKRQTIGTEQTIDGVNEKDFHDYYGTWYTASSATVMVVADADPADVIKVLKEKFGGAPKRARPAPQASGIAAYEKSFAIVASDAELDSEDVRITHLEPVHPPTTTLSQFRDDLVLGLGESALNRRLDDKVGRGGTAYVSARVSSGDEPNALHSWEISGRAAPGQWKSALEGIALELQRARVFGFNAHEIEDVKKQMVSGAERAVETEATIPAQGLVSRMNAGVTSGDAMLSPRQRLDLLTQFLPTIGGEEITKRFAAEYDPKAVAFIAVLPAGKGVPTEAQLLEIGAAALAVKPTQDAEVAHATQLLAELPKPGEVKEGGDHAATKTWSGWLANNVRVHYRFIDTRKNEVEIHVTLLGGELLETAANRGVTSAAQVAWGRAATKTLSSSDIRELMTGKKVSVRGGGGGGGGRGRGGRGGGGGGGGPASIGLTVSGSPEDVETGFQLAYLLLTQPKIEAASFTQFQSSMRQSLTEASKNPMALGMRTANSAPYPDDDARLQSLTPEQVDRLTVEASQAWLEKLIKESPIEVAVVGDLPKERALDLVTRYIGSLPSRERVGPETYLALRTLKRPQGPRNIEKSLETPTAQAFVLSGFYGTDESNTGDARALNMAARVLSSRMVTEIREQAQLVYSIGAQSRAGATFPGFGIFAAAAPTEPHKAAALVEKVASMYDLFAKAGPTDAEMDVGRKQMANTFEEQLKDPAYWMSKLEQMSFRGTRLDDVAADPAAYQALTGEQVKAAFAKYYSKESSIVVVVKPTGVGPAGKEPAPPVKGSGGTK